MGGNIVSLVTVDNNEEALSKTAMHVAALKPIYLSKEDVDADYIKNEKNFIKSNYKKTKKS